MRSFTLLLLGFVLIAFAASNAIEFGTSVYVARHRAENMKPTQSSVDFWVRARNGEFNDDDLKLVAGK